MKPTISSRDLEQLSAHLDGKLTERQQAALQTRLAAQAQLRQALAQLQQTRALLRRAPQRKLRRAFTLTPAMGGVSSRGSLGGWTGFNLASATASLGLILVLLADFSANGLPVPAVGLMKEPEPLMAEMSEAAEEAGAAIAPLASPQALTLEQPPELADDALDATAARSISSPTNWVAENAGLLEALLASIATISGLAAWHRRRG